jgi:hypothetical protein
MNKSIRRWLNRYKNQRRKKQFEGLVGLSLDSLVKSCEEIVLKKTGDKVYSKFRDLGGANNHGMLLHYSVQSNQPVAISKIEESSLAEREYRFLEWQKDHRANALAAEPLGLASVSAQGYSCLITSVLQHPQVFSYFQAQQLFHLLADLPEKVDQLSLMGNKESLKDEIDDSTKIKSILVHLVSQFGTDAADDFYKAYLKEREWMFDNDPSLYIKLQHLMKGLYVTLKSYDMADYEGLVHGDFKQQNIMEYSDSYRVIDCQYYTYGIRLWDLAFLYSKDTSGFDNIREQIDKTSLFEEKLITIFFYIVASLINVKKKRTGKVIKYQILPAALYASQQLGFKEYNES